MSDDFIVAHSDALFAPGVIVLDDPASASYPLAIDAAGRDEVFVGRIRRDPGHERAGVARLDAEPRAIAEAGS